LTRRLGTVFYRYFLERIEHFFTNSPQNTPFAWLVLGERVNPCEGSTRGGGPAKIAGHEWIEAR
jgi:hypothetical protein